MKGSPAKLGTIQGTSGHASALKAKSYKQFKEEGGDVSKAKKWNLKKYGTENPTADAKKAGISKSELSKQFKNHAGRSRMEISLKLKIVESGIKNYEIANNLKWHPSKLSQIVNGACTATMEEKAQIAKELGVDVAEVFPQMKEKLQ